MAKVEIARTVLRYLLAVFFVGGGINHFRIPAWYVNLMPPYMPLHEELVWLSGVTEVIAGVMVAVPAWSRWGGWFVIAHLIAFMPVHIHMAVNPERYTDMGPPGAMYFRIVLQGVFVVWAWWAAAARTGAASEAPPGPA
ncbi:MAG: DoxX family membrane protein [Candidatus Hydrogenedentota bacterium]